MLKPNVNCVNFAALLAVVTRKSGGGYVVPPHTPHPPVGPPMRLAAGFEHRLSVQCRI